MRGFYERFYRPDNMVLTITGQIDPLMSSARLKTEFGSLPAIASQAIAPLPPLPAVDGPDFVYHAEPEAGNGWVGLMAIQHRAPAIEQTAQAPMICNSR